MPKKNKPNAFYYYMCSRQDDVSRSEGRKIPMSQMSSFVHIDWKQLPAKEKKIYENMADDAKSCSEKMDCRGVPYSEIEQREKDAKKKDNDMKDDIIQTIRMLQSANGLIKKTFYVLSTSYYVLTEEGSYIPAEIGICKFSFKEGIMSVFNRILPVSLPSGYRHEAMQHSENSHNLMNAEEGAHGDLSRIPNEILLFIRESGSPTPPLYCREDQREQCEKVMKHFGLEQSLGKPLKIYSLEFFLANVYFVLKPTHRIPESIAEEMLDSCTFDYMENLPCQWHKDNAPDAGKYCTLALCRKAIYLMFDNINVKESFNVTPLPDKHLPVMHEYISNEDDDPPSPVKNQRYVGEFQVGFSESSSANYAEEFPTLGASGAGSWGPQAGPKGVGNTGDDAPRWIGGVGRGKKLPK